MVATFFLLENLIWDFAERRLSRKYIKQYKPFPLPSADERLFNSSDVSIIVPTVSCEVSSFLRSMIIWLANEPLEIIVVTANGQRDQIRAILGIGLIRAANKGTSITVLPIELANKREQLVEGIRLSKGRIIALANDDVIWGPQALSHLLAPFQVPDIGLVGGPIESYVPEARQSSSIVSAYEVAALWHRSKQRDGNKAFYVGDGSTNFTVSGATMLLRAEVVKDPVFQNEFMDEKFAGVRLNSGGDAFITRWVLFQHLRPNRRHLQEWKLGMQFTSEATIFTTLIQDEGFIDQIKRWSRTGLRTKLICIFRQPGIWKFWRSTPYMCRKMFEGLYIPLLNLLWYVAFFIMLRQQPLLALLIGLYYFYGMVVETLQFAKEFPYCRRKLWVVLIANIIAPVSYFYSWVTLFSEDRASPSGVDGANNEARMVIE